IRDPRDDENRFIASLHTIVRRFHNLWVDRLALEHRDWSSTRVFAEAQRQVRLHYQWAVLTDFLPTIVGKPTLAAVLPSTHAPHKPDTSPASPLRLPPLPETGAGPASLARRNLLRSMQLGLPSGQDVARAMGVKPLRDDQILIGKAVEPEAGQEAESQPITGIARSFAGKAPLWTYILAEATAGAFNIRDG